jgi:hypothetical protein
MTNKDLTWKLKAQPTAGELADLVKHGVLTADEARAIIFNKGKKTSQSGKTTVVHLLLDTSGSMESVRNATISGYNEYIHSLKEDGGKYKVSLTLFDSDHEGKLRLEKRYESLFVDDVPDLTRETYKPNGGTPLHDAFCMTLKDMKDREDEKYLFVVLTDGEENASREYSAKDMKNLKKKFEAKDNWTFIYLGANQDSFATAKVYDFSASNVSNFNATPAGASVMFASLGTATRSFSASAQTTTDAYFTSEQQTKNENTK